MINHVADCIRGTCTNAGILAFISHASFVSGAVVVKYTFWSTTDGRIPIVIGHARTDSVVANSVRSTG